LIFGDDALVCRAQSEAFGKSLAGMIAHLAPQTKRLVEVDEMEDLADATLKLVTSKVDNYFQDVSGPSRLLTNPFVQEMWKEHCGMLGALDEASLWQVLMDYLGKQTNPRGFLKTFEEKKAEFLTRLDVNGDKWASVCSVSY
jgi:hypothetical protein